MTIRTTGERIADTKKRLSSDNDVWIATASAEGIPHLIPLSLAWEDGLVVVVTPTDSPTARNVRSTSRARASLESTTDVVVMNTVADSMDLGDCDDDRVQRLVDRIGWDPRTSDIAWSVLTLTPTLIHAWRMEPEIADRTIMRNGKWIE